MMFFSTCARVQEIWCRIHFLLPMQVAARAACVSRSFLHSWRCHPNLTFTNETMCPKEDLKGAGLDYNNKIDHVLRNCSCADAVTKLKLDYHVPPDDAESYHCLDSWLRMAVTPTTKELELLVWSKEASFDFPCTLLSDRSGGSIQKLLLFRCALRPTFQLGLRSLKTLHLHDVRVTGEELGCLLSSSTALEQLKLVYCDDIVRLEIPCLLQRLSFLEVAGCMSLQVIENRAPNLSRFYLEAGERVQVSFGESKVKKVQLVQSCAISYAIDNLPSRAPNLETLTIYSTCERINAPMVASSKFLHLKFLSILLMSGSNFDKDYDYLSLVPFFQASPALETFCLFVAEHSMYHLFKGDRASLRGLPQNCHGNLSKPARKCSTPRKATAIVKARKSILVVKKYIKGNVPSTVKLNVPKPCQRCHRF
ncbi:hypothetical protein VPH35_098469 [Triticum aestivum]